MTPQDRTNHTPLLTFRFPRDEQDEFAANATRAGSSKSEVLVAFVRWYNRKPGARMPKRPPAPSAAQP